MWTLHENCEPSTKNLLIVLINGYIYIEFRFNYVLIFQTLSDQSVHFHSQFPLLACLPAKTWARICIDQVPLTDHVYVQIISTWCSF